ncbi:MAG: ABC transporter ATP-binding protein [Eubacteriales bacterium]|nr:ABC transporter ATP-binding protein [Eubacteriales bacterium]
MIGLMKRIYDTAGAYKGRIRLAFLFSFLKSMFSKAPMMLAFAALSLFYEGEMAPARCLQLGAAMTACVLAQVLFQNLADRLQSGAGYQIFAQKRIELAAHLRRMPMGYFTEGNIGRISSVLSTDMVFIEENCMTVLADLMSYVFSQIIMIGFMLFFNVWLGLLSLAVVAVIWLIAGGMKRESLEDSELRQEQSQRLTGAVIDFAEGIGIIKAYNMLGEKSGELSRNFRKSCETNLRFEIRHSPWQRGIHLAYGLGTAAVIALALFLEARAILTPLYAVGVLLFAFDLFAPLKAFYTQSTRLTVMNSCLDRIEAVYAESELPDTGTKRFPVRTGSLQNGRNAAGQGAIDAGNAQAAGTEVAAGQADGRYRIPAVEFRNVHFGYGEKEVIRGVSFQLYPDTMTALVGPSGGGKSTLASLLARFWDVRGGEVLLNGVELRQAPLSDLMEQISMVFQRVYLFQDTIYNNIRMGRMEATREEIVEAAKKARCYDFIMALPEGFETMVGEGGANLSGGEKQRISIARCILKDAPIVILDEATASVDADNESCIQEAIGELCRGKTLLVIAHRLNTIRHADQILVVEDGRIAERGTHESLMEQDGLYRRFVSVREKSGGWNRRA